MQVVQLVRHPAAAHQLCIVPRRALQRALEVGGALAPDGTLRPALGECLQAGLLLANVVVEQHPQPVGEALLPRHGGVTQHHGTVGSTQGAAELLHGCVHVPAGGQVARLRRSRPRAQHRTAGMQGRVQLRLPPPRHVDQRQRRLALERRRDVRRRQVTPPEARTPAAVCMRHATAARAGAAACLSRRVVGSIIVRVVAALIVAPRLVGVADAPAIALRSCVWHAVAAARVAG